MFIIQNRYPKNKKIINLEIQEVKYIDVEYPKTFNNRIYNYCFNLKDDEHHQHCGDLKT